jgi:hypothetical protein
MAKLIGSPVASIKRLEKRVLEGLAEVVDRVAENNRKKFELAVRNWKNRARFIKRPVSSDKGVIKKQVVAQGSAKVLAIFGYVDEGTEAHFIFPKNKKALRFSGSYSARTSPVANPNTGTGKSSGQTVFSQGVLHPGTEARDFTGYYALEAQEELTRDVRALMRRFGRRRL